MSGLDGELVQYPFWVRYEGKNDTSEHVLSSLAFDVFLAESGSLQLTDGQVQVRCWNPVDGVGFLKGRIQQRITRSTRAQV